jgi:hypothetical protein
MAQTGNVELLWELQHPLADWAALWLRGANQHHCVIASQMWRLATTSAGFAAKAS